LLHGSEKSGWGNRFEKAQGGVEGNGPKGRIWLGNTGPGKKRAKGAKEGGKPLGKRYLKAASQPWNSQVLKEPQQAPKLFGGEKKKKKGKP